MTVTPKALWTWDTSDPNSAFPTAYNATASNPAGTPTKTGLTADALRDFCGVPLIYRGTPQRPVSDAELLTRIRRAEDWVEETCGVKLCPTYVASQPITTAFEASTAGITPISPDGTMHEGVDYDMWDAPYDFQNSRSQDDGWLITTIRYRPLRVFDGARTAVKSVFYTYPLLNEYYVVDPSWFVEQRDSAYLRIVPSRNVTMLPLFALQLAVQGFSESLPGGWNVYYTCGFTQADYKGKFNFVPELVLTQAAISILGTLQGTVSMGANETSTLTDGVQFSIKYDPKGAYAALINNFRVLRDEHMETLYWNVLGPVVNTL